MFLISTCGLKKGKSTPMQFKVLSHIEINNEMIIPADSKIDIHTYITNFEFMGCEKTIFPNGGWKADHSYIDIENYAFNIKQIEGYKEIIEQIKKNNSNSITAKVIVRTDLKGKDKINPIITKICELLSFATSNSVVPIIEEHLSNRKSIYKKTISKRVDIFRSGDRLIPHLLPEAIKDFLIKTYPSYKKFREPLKLNVLFDYYLLMKSNPVLDVRCLLGFILLECLSNNAQEYFSKNGKPIESNIRKSKINKLDKILPKSNNLSKKTKDKLIQELIYQQPSLQDSISRLMKDFSMKYKKGEARIWELRKAFIHKGMYPENTKDSVQIYRIIVHFIDRLLLHILNYDGEFLNIAERFKNERIALSVPKK